MILISKSSSPALKFRDLTGTKLPCVPSLGPAWGSVAIPVAGAAILLMKWFMGDPPVHNGKQGPNETRHAGHPGQQAAKTVFVYSQGNTTHKCFRLFITRWKNQKGRPLLRDTARLLPSEGSQMKRQGQARPCPAPKTEADTGAR